MKKKKILFLVNNLDFFVSHRLPLGRAMLSKGYKVTICYGENNDTDIRLLKKKGFKICLAPIFRSSINLFNELKSLFLIWKIIKKEKPDIVHSITIKPNLYGGIVSRLLNVPCLVTAVSGLGTLFGNKNFKNVILRLFLIPLYKLAFDHNNQKVIVQNLDDLRLLKNLGVLNPLKAKLIKGSGVNLRNFTKLKEPKKTITICLAARLIKEKGVYEFITAAKLIKLKNINAKFLLAGKIDLNNPSNIPQSYLDKVRKEGYVEIIGYQKNIPKLYAKSHIVCLPSYYKEGLPKSLIEAAAASRAVVTTNFPGCRDAIIPNKSGITVPIQNAKKLAEALQWLIENHRERLKMGKVGRRLAEREFKIEKIIHQHFEIYNQLFKNISSL